MMSMDKKNYMNKGERSKPALKFGGQQDHQNQKNSEDDKHVDQQRNPQEQVPSSKEYKKGDQNMDKKEQQKT